MSKLDQEEIASRLQGLSGWRIEDHCLRKDLVFKDFAQAWQFMDQLAVNAERMNHHPDWSNSYNKVSISLTSHDVGGLSVADFDYARAADEAERELTGTS